MNGELQEGVECRIQYICAGTASRPVTLTSGGTGMPLAQLVRRPRTAPCIKHPQPGFCHSEDYLKTSMELHTYILNFDIK